MAYSTQSQLISRFDSVATVAELTDSSNLKSPDTDVLDEVRASADGMIDAYLSAIYVVPVDTSVSPSTADLLAGLSLDIGQYNLILRKRRAPEHTVKQRDDAIKTLVKIAERKIPLPGAESLAETDAIKPVWGSRDPSSTSKRSYTRDTQRAL